MNLQYLLLEDVHVQSTMDWLSFVLKHVTILKDNFKIRLHICNSLRKYEQLELLIFTVKDFIFKSFKFNFKKNKT